VAVAAASTPYSPRPAYHPAPSYGPAPSYHQPSYKEPQHYDEPYQFDYAVNDHYSGAVFSQNENSDAKNVNGYYSVNLPDGRTQLVKYIVDGYSGYNAEVSYEGYANHPQVPKGYAQPTYGGHAYRPVVAHPVVRAH